MEEPGRTNSTEKCPPYRFRAISLKDYGVVHPSGAEWQSRLCPRGVPIPCILLLLFIHYLTSDSLQLRLGTAKTGRMLCALLYHNTVRNHNRRDLPNS